MWLSTGCIHLCIREHHKVIIQMETFRSVATRGSDTQCTLHVLLVLEEIRLLPIL